jgi:hypothetical protein
MEKLMIQQRAGEFVYAQNHRKNKDVQMVEKMIKKFALLDEKDYDCDGISDTVVTKDKKVYSFNGFLPKDTDYPLCREFLLEGKQHQNRFENQ